MDFIIDILISDNNNMFHDRLSYLLHQKKITKVELANHLEIARSTLDGYLNGKTFMPSDKIQMTARYLNVSVGYLFGETDSGTSLQELQNQLLKLAEKVDTIANSLQIKT